MCVEVKNSEAKSRVIAYKLFDVREKRINGLCRDYKYSLNKIYESPGGPGFQAFADLPDARITATGAWKWMRPRIYKVVFYRAKLGTIRGMDSYSDGKPGWIAPKMKIIGRVK
jgi:hypothetical protein